MDPVSAGAMKQVHQNMFEQAEQQIQKSDKQVSDFEKLRQKLEEQDSISNQQQQNQINQSQNTNQVNQTDQVNSELQVQKAGEVPNTNGVPEIQNMDELQSMVNNIRHGQHRLSQIISDATSGKTYSPEQMLAMQAEVSKITTELDTATKIVQHFVESVKTTLNMQL
jgi:hypothetical protein